MVEKMSDKYEYNLGYFEGIRNALRAYHQFPNIQDFYLWLDKEMKEAKELRDESYNEMNYDECTCFDGEIDINCRECY